MLNDLTAIKALETQIEDLKRELNELKNEQVKTRRMNEDLMYNLDSDNIPALKDGVYLAKVINGSTHAIIKADHITLEGMEIDLTGKNITISSDNFNVDAEGNLVCENAVVRGQIFATGGTFDDGDITNADIRDADITNADIDTATIANANILHTCHLLSDGGTSGNKMQIGGVDGNNGIALYEIHSGSGSAFKSTLFLRADGNNGKVAFAEIGTSPDVTLSFGFIDDDQYNYQVKSDGIYLNNVKITN